MGDQELFRDRPHAYNDGRAETTKQQQESQHNTCVAWSGGEQKHFVEPETHTFLSHIAEAGAAT